MGMRLRATWAWCATSDSRYVVSKDTRHHHLPFVVVDEHTSYHDVTWTSILDHVLIGEKPAINCPVTPHALPMHAHVDNTGHFVQLKHT